MKKSWLLAATLLVGLAWGGQQQSAQAKEATKADTPVFEVSPSQGWQEGEKPGDWYYLLPDGNRMKNGWKEINTLYYYFDENGLMAHDTWVGSYYLRSSGSMVVDKWIKDEVKQAWYYVGSDGKYVRNGWNQINEKTYYFLETGRMVADRWIDDHYLKPNGAMAVGEWVKSVELQAWYMVDETGLCVRKQWKEWKGDYYYFLDNGKMATDKWIDGCYLKPNGVMMRNEWIWVPKDGAWYYTQESGYYAYAKWLEIKGQYFHFASDGKMTRNRWVGDYYLLGNGVMATNQTVEDQYYVDANGRYRQRVYIDTPFYNQNPDAVSGCEAYSLTQALHAIGKASWVSPYTMTTYVPQSPNGDPRNGFAGSQYSIFSLGGLVSTIYPKPLTPLAKYYAPNSENTTGYTVDQLKAELVKGNPVVIWATSGVFAEPIMRKQWFGWEPLNPHVVTLIGFDDARIYISDPTYGKYSISLWRFTHVYDVRGRMSLTVRH